jgi:alpha,alpha-trehalose phosphorylase
VILHDAYRLEPWAVRETALDLEVLAQSESVFALANGHLGLRGNLDEGEPRALSGTYLNGFFESHPISYGERAYGFPEAGQRIVNVTDGKLIRLLVEDEPLDVHRGTLEEHERILDLRAGTLERKLRWTSSAGRSVRVVSRRLVSLRDRSVAAISYEVEAVGTPLRVALQSNLLANQADAPATIDPRSGAALGPVLESRLAVDEGLRVVLAHATTSSGLALAAGMDHLLDQADEVATLTQSEPDLGRVTVSATLEPGAPLRMVKLLAYHWSSQQSVEWLRDQVDGSLEIALTDGFDGLARAQREYLDEYWSHADVELEGDPELQLALRFALFQVLQATARAEGRAIPAKGLTGPGYDGHAFWDTESFVLPVLTYVAPALARDALIWRHSTLDMARNRARQLGLSGAAFPWRTIHGEECSGYWPAGTAATHVNADIADAVRRYVACSGETGFERDYGVELLVETARLWSALGHYGREGAFRIDGVTGPDEYSALADNNVYTNLMAQANLLAAAEAVARHADVAERLDVGRDEAASWRAAADAMFIPYEPQLGVHPQDQDFLLHERWDFDATTPDQYPLMLHHTYFDLYRKQVIKQADLVLALFLRGDSFTAEEKRRDFDYYDALTVRDSSLSASVQAIVAAEVGHLQLAHDYLAEAGLIDLGDLEHNVRDGLHVASLAGAVLAAVAGLGGLRDHAGELSFTPRLPPKITRLRFSVAHRAHRVRVEVTPDHARYVHEEGREDLHMTHWGTRFALAPEGDIVHPIPRVDPQPAPNQPRHRKPKHAGRRHGQPDH